MQKSTKPKSTTKKNIATSTKSVKFLRDKMRKADFRLVDLAEFLDISRPTAYKFIELYERGQKDKIQAKVLRLFEFIDKQEDLSRIGILRHIATINLGKQDTKESKAQKEEIIASLLKKENKTKIDFIDLLSSSEIYDAILGYLLECAKIISRPNPTQSDLERLEPLIAFYASLNLKISLNYTIE